MRIPIGNYVHYNDVPVACKQFEFPEEVLVSFRCGDKVTSVSTSRQVFVLGIKFPYEVIKMLSNLQVDNNYTCIQVVMLFLLFSCLLTAKA